MKIAIILATTSISGGLNVVLEHAGHLVRAGHCVDLVILSGGRLKNLVWHRNGDYFKIIELWQAMRNYYDIVIATFWTTCMKAHMVPANHYIYFVQSIESRFYSTKMEQAQAEATYLMGFEVITEATWIKRYLADRYGIVSWLVRNGVEKKIYLPWMKKRNLNTGIFRVLVEGPIEVEFKNVRKTISLCKQSMADEIWFLTSSDVTSYPDVDRVYSRVPISQTPQIYGNCDLLVKLSYVEGMFGPPLEMFHCGGTAIVYNVSGCDEYIRNGINAIVIESNDEKSVIYNINNLYTNRKRLKYLQDGALATAVEWRDWTEASEEFEVCLLTIHDLHPSNRSSIIHKIDMLRKHGASVDGTGSSPWSKVVFDSWIYEFIKQFERKIRHHIKRW